MTKPSKPTKPAQPDQSFLTIKQVAERLHLSEKTIRRLITRGDLMAHQFGTQYRISEADLSTYLRLHRGLGGGV